MGSYKFEEAVKHPETMCKDCSNIIGSIDVFANDPHKAEGKGIKLSPQWGCFSDSMLQGAEYHTYHAYIMLSYSIRDHTDPEKAKKFVMETKHMDVSLCKLGKQLPFIHTDRQDHSEYPEIRKKLDRDGVPRMLDIDGHLFCKFCGNHKTYQAYANGSWKSTLETCTNPECSQNGGPINKWQEYIDNKVICPECEWKMQKGKCVNKLCEVYVLLESVIGENNE